MDKLTLVLIGIIIFAAITFPGQAIEMCWRENLDTPLCLILEDLQEDVGSDCGAGECVYGVNDDGSLDCRACAGGGGGGGVRWLNTTQYLYINASYAGNVTARGWINSTDWRNVTITESQITDLYHTPDTNISDTNASTACSGEQILMGNNSCGALFGYNTTINSSYEYWTNATLYDRAYNASYEYWTNATLYDRAYNASYEYWTNTTLTDTVNASYDYWTNTTLTDTVNASYDYWTNATLTNWTRSATRIISASNSDNKLDADYICDGANDEVQIEQAIADLNNLGGGKIILLEGNYSIGSSIDFGSTDDDMILQGQGFMTTLESTSDIIIITVTDSQRVIIQDLHLMGNLDSTGVKITGNNDCKNIWINRVYFETVDEGIIIDGTASGGSGNFYYVTNNIFYHTDNYGLHNHDGDFIFILNNNFFKQMGYGIRMNTGQWNFVEIDNNHIHIQSGGTAGMYIEATSQNPPFGNIVISKNLMQTKYATYGIYTGAQQTEIIGNMIEGDTGVYVAGQKSEVVGNIFSQSEFIPIHLTSTANENIISNNIIRDVGGGDTPIKHTGIFVEGDRNTISNNLMRSETDNGQSGINISGDNNAATGNFIRDFDIGILTTGMGNTVSSNTITDSDLHGMSINNTNGSRIVGNTVLRATRNGIALYGTNDSIVSNNYVEDSDLANTQTYDGIHVGNGSNNNVISTNRLLNNDRFELLFDTYTTNNLFGSNVLVGTDRLEGYADNGTSNWDMGGNLEGTSMIYYSKKLKQFTVLIEDVTEYFFEDDQMRLFTNNLRVDTDTLFVDSALDRVGINTAAPSSDLEVVGNVIFSQNLTMGDYIIMDSNEMIDNWHNGWIRVTGGLNVTNNIISNDWVNSSKINTTKLYSDDIITTNWSNSTDVNATRIHSEISCFNSTCGQNRTTNNTCTVIYGSTAKFSVC